jgi:subtilisin family serine protease
MKFCIFTFSFLLFSTHAFSAQLYNGYIVKLKKSSNFVNNTFLSMVTKTSFGTYAKVEENNISHFLGNSNIEYIEPNYIVHSVSDEDETPSDSYFSSQWGLSNSGKNSGTILTRGVPHVDINILKAWTQTMGAPSIKIAVIDTGVDYKHPDLKDQIDINEKEFNGTIGVDDDGNGFVDDIYGYNFYDKNGDPRDDNGHGTHCAGVIGAAHNGLGIAGVMKEVKIIPVKFLNAKGAGDNLSAVSAIDYAMKRGANIMSNSWGGSQKSQAIEDAIAATEKAGITFIAAAGNSTRDNDSVAFYPASYKSSNIISVGSFAANGKLSKFSNYGINSVHVTAPGSYILSTFMNGKYKVLSGTSMAAPHVAGVVGLLLSKEPNLKPSEIRERLIKTSVKTDYLKNASVSGGRIDAYKVLTE